MFTSSAAGKSIYVEGIAYSASEDDVKEFFESRDCGTVTSVRMPRYHDSNRPRGYAHIDFLKPKGVKNALKLNGEEHHNRGARHSGGNLTLLDNDNCLFVVTLSGQELMGRYLKIELAKEPRSEVSRPAVAAKPPGELFVIHK